MSDIKKSNDYNELSLMFPDIFDEIRELYSQNPFKFKYNGLMGDKALDQLLFEEYQYWNSIFAEGAFSNYVLCFSEAADSLGQWRGYADNGKGCCLGFSFEEIENYCTDLNGILRLEKVIYLEEEGIIKLTRDNAKRILSELKGLRKWIVKEITLDDNCDDTDGLLRFNLGGMLESVFVDSLQYKSFAFHSEQEWRLFLANPPRKDQLYVSKQKDLFTGRNELEKRTLQFLCSKINFQSTETDLISFCTIPFSDFVNNPVKSLWIGPKNDIRECKLFCVNPLD